MALSKLTQKYQTTIPAEVRKKLNLKQGDVIQFKIKNNVVELVKATQFDLEWHKSLQQTLTEWEGDDDDVFFKKPSLPKKGKK